MIKAIFIDAGHGLGPTGAIDNGATGNGTTERQEVVSMAQTLFTVLKADPSFAGISVFKIAVDSRMMLKDHIKEINDLCRQNGWTADTALVLSLHINAAGDPAARGIEAWYSPQEGTVDFARALVEQVNATTGLPIRTRAILTTAENRHGRLGIIDDTIARGCLFEAGFITNEFDAAYLKNAQMEAKIVEGLHRAIRVYLALPAASAPSAPPAFYTDVPALAWYAGDVKLCLNEGLFKMPPDGLFHPDHPVTRAELAAVMARHLHRQHGMI